jgi:predicted DNA-binding transcriptional regulator YafY
VVGECIYWLVRLMLRLGATGELLDPPDLAAEVRRLASQALLNYT